jgi:hypothetical protein
MNIRPLQVAISKEIQSSNYNGVVHINVKKDANMGPMGQTKKRWFRLVLEDIKKR